MLENKDIDAVVIGNTRSLALFKPSEFFRS